MSFIYEDPVSLPPGPGVFADGVAGLGDVYRAARDATIFVDNFNASEQAIEEAYDRRIDAIAKATGQVLVNPVRDDAEVAATQDPRAALSLVDARVSRFKADVARLQQQHPDKARDIRAHVDIMEDAKMIAREAEGRLDAALGSRSDFTAKWAAVLGGGFSGMLRDPLQVITLFAGGGAGAGRSVGRRILNAAAREAVVNAGVEAAQQPQVQAWRRTAGLDAGFDEGLRNTLMAAGFAGVLGGAGQGAAEIFTRMIGGLPDGAPIRRAIEGNANDAADVLAPIAGALRPEARGAIEAAQADQALAVARPPGIDPEAHDRALAAGIRAAEEDGPIVEIDLTRPRRTGGLNRPMNVMEVIADAGGLRDDAGELAARGLSFRNTMTRFGPAFRKAGEDVGSGGGLFGGAPRRIGKGRSADDIRRILVERGFLDEIEGREAVTTVDDVYRLIDDHLQGKTVISRADQSWQEEIEAKRLAKDDGIDRHYPPEQADFIRRYNYEAFETLRQAGIDPATIRRDDADMAWKLVEDEGLDFGDALERAAIMAMDNDVARIADTAEIDDIPFFSEVPDAGLRGNGRTLRPGGGENTVGRGARGVRDQRRAQPDAGEAAGREAGEGGRTAGRIAAQAVPKPEGGIDNPLAPEIVKRTDEQIRAATADGAELPPEFSIDNMMAEIERGDELAQLVDACKAV